MTSEYDFSVFDVKEHTFGFANLTKEQADEKRQLYEQFVAEKEALKASASVSMEALVEKEGDEKPAVKPAFKPSFKPKMPGAKIEESIPNVFENPVTEPEKPAAKPVFKPSFKPKIPPKTQDDHE
jgi:NADH-quinone oxidoreductase subunit I